MPPMGFEPTIAAGDRPLTYALDCAATGIGITSLYISEFTQYQKRSYFNAIFRKNLVYAFFNA